MDRTRGEGRGDRSPRVRDARPGSTRPRARRCVRATCRRASRDRDVEWHHGAPPRDACAQSRPRRRGDHEPIHIHRLGEQHHVHGREARVCRHRRVDFQHRSREAGGRDHTADACSDAGSSIRPTVRHGRDLLGGAEARPRRPRRCGASGRRHLPRPPGGQLRDCNLQPLRNQEHHERRGRRDHDRR